MNNNNEKIDLKEAFEEYARKELEFYEKAEKNKVYTRIMPNLKEKDKGMIDLYYNGIKLGGYIYKNEVALNKLKVTKFGSEDCIEDAVKAVEKELNKAGLTCDNQLK